MEGQKTEQTTQPAAPAAPAATNDQGTKVYSTSYIPQKAVLHLPKPEKAALAHWHIEAVHIVIFFLLLVGLFYKMWIHPNQR